MTAKLILVVITAMMALSACVIRPYDNDRGYDRSRNYNNYERGDHDRHSRRDH